LPSIKDITAFLRKILALYASKALNQTKENDKFSYMKEIGSQAV
jgi:hypothetical protein